MNQMTIDFETASPINKDKLNRQNKLIYEHLNKGQKINVFMAITRYQIFHLHSRISELRNKHKIQIYDRMITVNGNTCKEYSLTPFI